MHILIMYVKKHEHDNDMRIYGDGKDATILLQMIMIAMVARGTTKMPIQ